jgi:hypothetical protein
VGKSKDDKRALSGLRVRLSAREVN